VKFLGDMGVSPRVVAWLRAGGHDATDLREQGLKQLPDSEVFAKAAREHRILLTFDLDFGELVGLGAQPGTSVIVFRLRDTRVDHVIERLRDVLAQSSDVLEAGVIVAVEDGRHRVRRLPP
jgi:predicted nuclease of predicted toxin-antitoxin system